MWLTPTQPIKSREKDFKIILIWITSIYRFLYNTTNISWKFICYPIHEWWSNDIKKAATPNWSSKLDINWSSKLDINGTLIGQMANETKTTSTHCSLVNIKNCLRMLIHVFYLDILRNPFLSSVGGSWLFFWILIPIYWGFFLLHKMGFLLNFQIKVWVLLSGLKTLILWYLLQHLQEHFHFILNYLNMYNYWCNAHFIWIKTSLKHTLISTPDTT